MRNRLFLAQLPSAVLSGTADRKPLRVVSSLAFPKDDQICCTAVLGFCLSASQHPPTLPSEYSESTRERQGAGIRLRCGRSIVDENAQRCGIFIKCPPARQTRGLVSVLTSLGFLSSKLISTYQRRVFSSRVYLERLASALPALGGQSTLKLSG